MTRLINAVVSPGGELQKRRAFVKVASLAGTKGLASVGDKLVAFRATGATGAAPSIGVTGITFEYHDLPGLTATSKMMDYEPFDGNLYVTFYDSAGTTPAAKNPHYYFDATATDGHTPTNLYVLTEGSGKGYYVRSFQGKMYSVTGKYLYFSSVKYPVLWEETAIVPPSGATVVSVLPVQGVANERVILPAKKLWYTWTLNTNGIGSWVQSTPDQADLDWITNKTQRTGSGYINVSLQESGGAGLLGLEIYYDKMALMSGGYGGGNGSTQLWACDPDPNQNALSQVLRNNGTIAAKSVLQFGSGDVLYLAPSGIRSLKARDASNSAAVTDIGSPVDSIVRALGQMKSNGRLYLANASAVVEPVTGRFWMAFPDTVLVLSYFPGPKIQAWSQFTFPFQIDYIVAAGDRIFIRAGDDLYAYGGHSGEEYDDCAVEVRFPYLDASKPGHNKIFEAVDATAEGQWDLAVSFNFDHPDDEEQLGTLSPRAGADPMSASTWNKGRFSMQGYSSHISMRFYSNSPGFASLANCALHYKLSDDEA